PVPTFPATGGDEPDVHRFLRRGQVTWLRGQHDAHSRSDPDRTLLGSSDPELLERDRPDGGAGAWDEPGAERAPVRPARPDARRLRHAQLPPPPWAGRSLSPARPSSPPPAGGGP